MRPMPLIDLKGKIFLALLIGAAILVPLAALATPAKIGRAHV